MKRTIWDKVQDDARKKDKLRTKESEDKLRRTIERLRKQHGLDTRRSS